MGKHFFIFFWSIIVLGVFCFLLFTPSGTDCCRDQVIDDVALFIHTELSVKVKSREEIIATVTLRNDTTFPYWVFPAVIPSDHPTMPVFDILYPGAGRDLEYTGPVSGNFIRWTNFDPRPVPTNSEEWIVLQPGESRNWSCNLARQYDFDALLDRGVDSFKIGYIACNPYWPNGHPAEFVDPSFHWLAPVYHMLGFTGVPGPDNVLKWKWIRVN